MLTLVYLQHAILMEAQYGLEDAALMALDDDAPFLFDEEDKSKLPVKTGEITFSAVQQPSTMACSPGRTMLRCK